MYLSVINVQPLPDYRVHLEFENGEKRIFDVKPYLDLGVFEQLKEVSTFNSVRVSFDSIQWSNGADLDPELLYRDSVACEVRQSA